LIRRLALAALLLVAGPAAAATRWTEVARYPHDDRAFTEGLFIAEGELFESTGEYGVSDIRQVRLEDGKVLRRVALPPALFGEGIAPWRDRIVSLTWQDGQGFVWRRRDFRRLKTFRYAGEGWGLTQDGRRLIMSDGTDRLRFLDPRTLREKGGVAVTWNGQPVRMLNELEYVDGEVLANVWLTSLIARIDPASGHVIDWIDLSALVARSGARGPEAVLNGIAWDAKSRRLFVTGKNWPSLFEIRLDR
jgi:glutaminyl-peptide cyclotransferase